MIPQLEVKVGGRRLSVSKPKSRLKYEYSQPTPDLYLTDNILVDQSKLKHYLEEILHLHLRPIQRTTRALRRPNISLTKNWPKNRPRKINDKDMGIMIQRRT